MLSASLQQSPIFTYMFLFAYSHVYECIVVQISVFADKGNNVAFGPCNEIFALVAFIKKLWHFMKSEL